MTTTRSAQYILKQAASQNHAVAENLAKIAARSKATRKDTTSVTIDGDAIASSPLFSMRRYGYGPYCPYPAPSVRSPIFGVSILIIGIVVIGFVVGPTLYRILVTDWKTILLSLGGVCIGSGLIIVFGKIDKHPLKNVEPPDGLSDQPLAELEHLAGRTVSRLRIAYQIQISLVCVVAALLLFIVLWSIFMVTQNQLMYATAFGSSGIGMLALSKWKWQPFERVAEARKLADDADILATGLRLRIKSISEITDPKERAQAQWDAISEYLDRS